MLKLLGFRSDPENKHWALNQQCSPIYFTSPTKFRFYTQSVSSSSEPIKTSAFRLTPSADCRTLRGSAANRVCLRPLTGASIQMEAKFFRFLKIVGVGYKARAEAEGRMLYLKLGYSHEVELTVPPAVRVFCFKNNVVCCTGIDKDRVHQFAAAVRSCKPPEVYKGKGIMYVDEVIKKKQGKKSK
ncbi:hypothetical protein ACFXTH_002478 [Malus domestica]